MTHAAVQTAQAFVQTLKKGIADRDPLWTWFRMRRRGGIPVYSCVLALFGPGQIFICLSPESGKENPDSREIPYFSSFFRSFS